MSRAYDDAMEERAKVAMDAHVAEQLGITVDGPADYKYTIVENASDDGHPYGLLVEWEGEARPGVSANGSPGSLWSSIGLGPHEPDEPKED